jgi:hypothetical protein
VQQGARASGLQLGAMELSGQEFVSKQSAARTVGTGLIWMADANCEDGERMQVRRATGADVECWTKMRLALWPEGDLDQHRAEVLEQLAGLAGAERNSAPDHPPKGALASAPSELKRRSCVH